MSLLQVKNMSVSFKMYKKGLRQNKVGAISDISLDVDKGEILAIVGSSGSGKSLFAHAIMGLLPKNALVKGQIIYDGTQLTEKSLKTLRGKKIALVPQSISYLDPLMKIGRQYQGSQKGPDAKKRLREAFKEYSLCEDSEKLYPYQLSGGMARRAMIATADQEDVDLIIADEPTPGLDLELAMKTLKYFREFADKNKAVVLITHDIDLALGVADRIAIFYAGVVLEIASVRDFDKGLDHLRHPYTKALYRALPQNQFTPIKGSQPYDQSLAKGCLFAPRCDIYSEACQGEIKMHELRGGRVRCNNAT